MNAPFFSILIPLFNASSFLEDCINSILQQKVNNFECIICDDNSIDCSFDMVKKLVHNDHRFKVYQIEHSGVAVVRNFLLKRASGQYIIWIDPDDFVEDDFLKHVEKILTEKFTDVLTFNFTIFDGRKKSQFSLPFSEGKIDKEEIFRGLANDWPFPSQLWNKIIKRELYDNIEFPVEASILEDFSVLPYILNKANSFYHLDRYYYNYRKNPSSLLNAKEAEKEIYQLKARRRRLIYFMNFFPQFLDQCLSSWLISYFRTYCIKEQLGLQGDNKKNFINDLTSQFKTTKDLIKNEKINFKNRILLNINNKIVRTLLSTIYPILLKNKKNIYKVFFD